jgi:murein DD-endopeptidase MepM/ murein hydrolase activator NlpD
MIALQIVLLTATALTSTLPGTSWNWPLDGPHAVERQYLAPASAYAAGHRGVDLRALRGGVVRAPANGVVHFAGFVVDRPVLSIRHPDGVLASFEPVETNLERGDAVLAGDVIGTVLPGHCDDACLHVGARIDGQYVSPLRFLGGIARSVLLPTRPYADEVAAPRGPAFPGQALGWAVRYASVSRSRETCV